MMLLPAALCLGLASAAHADLSPYDGVVVSAVLQPDGASLSMVPRATLVGAPTQLLSSDSFAPGEAAWALFNDTLYLEVGWGKLEIHTNPNISDETCASAAGLLEGKITANRIYQNANNNGFGPDLVPSQTYLDFIKLNDQWIETMLSVSKLSTAADIAYWHHVNLINLQMQALHAGYTQQAAKAGLPPLKFEAILYMNMGDELGDFAGFKPGEEFVNKNTAKKLGELSPFQELEAGRCSALIKLLPDGSDIFIAQETWTGFGSMLRMYKMYDMPYTMTGKAGGERVPARRVSFSSYPGVLNSGDDFYVTSAGLVVQETTIGNSNGELAQLFVSPLRLMEWLRNMLANRLASSGYHWPMLYTQHNSGSYCNQNMILDYNLFTPGKPLQNGTVIVSEQIPGTVINSDVSELVQREGYFGSYNVAFDPYLRRISGAEAAAQKGGPWYEYWQTARAQLFKRDHKMADSGMEGMKAVMRKCDYLHDPLSHQQCADGYIQDIQTFHPISTTENCIATRGDLNPADGKFCNGAFAHRDHVGSDAKISSFSTWSEMVGATIVSGPTWGEQSGAGHLPVFCWSNASLSPDQKNASHHLGHPDCFNFPWVHMTF